MVGRVWTLFWIVTSVLTSDGAALGMTASEIVKSRPNTVLIQMDDTRWTDGVCFGSEFYRMRALDALAGSAARLTQVYAFTSATHNRPFYLQLEHYAVHGPLMGEPLDVGSFAYDPGADARAADSIVMISAL